MKKLSVLFICLFPALLMAQSVAINTDASQPHSSAILDIKSNSKGLLVPRMTTAQRTAIVSPAVGLTVFDVTTATYWIFRGDVNGNWVELLHSFDKHWDRSGVNVFNTNTGNVGIGTNSPSEKLTINAPDPAINFLNAGSAKGYIQASGNHMKLATYYNNTTGNIIFNTRATDRMWIDENGKVGIGTATPSGILTVNGANPWIEMQNSGVDKGFLLLNGNTLKLGTNATNLDGHLTFQTRLTDRMTIDENGKVGIGTNLPNAALTINAIDPVLQLKNDNVDMGFVQLVGDDLRIGTNVTNDFGSFIVRTNGSDRMSVTPDGKVNIAATPGSYNMLCIGENDNGWAGIDFKAGGNTTRGYLAMSANNGSLVQYGGEFSISSYGVGMKWLNNGNFVMGAADGATGYRLSVNGKVIGTEFTAMPYNNWPDYVFADDYKLKPLSELRSFIAANKHLPNIPPASAIAEQGIQLGDMSNKLMEKVEELTLYIFQLQDQVDELKKQIPAKKEN